MYELALFLHIISAVAFFSGAVVAAVCHSRARARASAAEVAALLGAARVGAVLVMAGIAGVLLFGLWLVDVSGRSFVEGWLAASLALLVAAAALGALGGKTPRRARELAERLAGEGAGVGPELRGLLDDRASLWLNHAATAAGVVILALMVFKPGAG